MAGLNDNYGMGVANKTPYGVAPVGNKQPSNRGAAVPQSAWDQLLFGVSTTIPGYHTYQAMRASNALLNGGGASYDNESAYNAGGSYYNPSGNSSIVRNVAGAFGSGLGSGLSLPLLIGGGLLLFFMMARD